MHKPCTLLLRVLPMIGLMLWLWLLLRLDAWLAHPLLRLQLKLLALVLLYIRQLDGGCCCCCSNCCCCWLQ